MLQLQLSIEPEVELNEDIILLDDPRYAEALQEFRECKYFAFDMETKKDDHKWDEHKKDALVPWRNKIRLIQVGLPSGLTIIADLGDYSNDKEQEVLDSDFMEVLRDKLACYNTKVVGHNLYFDASVIYWHYKYTIRCVRDTMIMAKMWWSGLDGRTGMKYSLGAVAKRVLGVEMDKSDQLFDWRLPVNNKQLNYGHFDVQIPLQIFMVLGAKIAKTKWLRSCIAACEITSLYAQTAMTGYHVNQDELDLSIKQHETLIEHFSKDIKEILLDGMTVDSPTGLIIKVLNDNGSKIEYNQFEHDELPKEKRPSLKDYLKGHKSKYIDSLLTTKSIAKRLQYLKAMKEVTEVDGRTHTNYNTFTDRGTGRTSSGSIIKSENSTGINVQNPAKSFPKDSPIALKCLELTGNKLINIRDLFTVPEGYSMYVGDLPQAHYIIATESARDKVGIQMFAEGIDQHALVGAKIASTLNAPNKYHTWQYIVENKGKDPQAKGFRNKGKTANYSQLNGSGANTMSKSSGMTIDECKATIAGWKDTFKGISSLMSRLVFNANMTNYDFNHYGVRGQWAITYAFNHRPLYKKKLHSAFSDKPSVYPSDTYSFHWLATEAEIISMIMIRMQKWLDENPQIDARIINGIHDELNFEVKDEHAAILAQKFDAVMHEEMTYYIKDVQIPKDDPLDGVGKRWSDK